LERAFRGSLVVVGSGFDVPVLARRAAMLAGDRPCGRKIGDGKHSWMLDAGTMATTSWTCRVGWMSGLN
jgi:hypothetical protein